MDFNLAGNPIHVNIGWGADHPKVTMQRGVQAVTGACMMVRREAWDKVTQAYRQAGDPSTGGFNLVYGRGTYEDLELCFAARSNGYRVIYEPAAVGYHHVGASAIADGQGFDLQRNLSIFRARCGHLMLWGEWMFY
jgi:GT2 family glycosyltransferase